LGVEKKKNNIEVGLTETTYWNVKYAELFWYRKKKCAVFSSR